MNEIEFINALRTLPLHHGARGLRDDCAVIEFGGEAMVLTHDAMTEGTHWLPGTDPYDIAWKLVATNLSDLAAKGAEPIGVILGHSLGNGDDRFIEGLSAILSAYDVPLLGGDTIASEGAPRTLGLTAIGRATCLPVPSRSGAEVGDGVFVCGVIGDAMAGYNELTKADRAGRTGISRSSASAPDSWFAERFLRPTPLLEEGKALAPHVTAMMDVSDGLFLDASRMAEASKVSFHLTLDAVPHSARFREYAAQGNQLDVRSAGFPVRDEACRWGDDYALLFTAARDVRLPIAAVKIGEVARDGGSPILVDGIAPEPTSLGYRHG